MRFLHTADWQVGMKAAHVGAAAKQVREERLAAGRRVVEAARAGGAEFLLLAGDTFEDNGVDRLLVRQIADLLAAFGGPVYILPGNHDPFVPGSVWEHGAWAEHSDLHILRSAEPLALPGGTLFPCPCLERHSGGDPTAWIECPAGSGIRLGLAHGSVEGLPAEALDRPIPRDAAARCDLDYLALGHWHSLARYEDGRGAVRTAYSGTPEPTGFGERDSGSALLVEIAGPGEPPLLEAVRTGRLRWISLRGELREEGDLARFRREVEALEGPPETLLDLRLEGLLPAGALGDLGGLLEVLATRFLFPRLDQAALHPRPDDPSWLAGLPEGPVRAAAERLLQLTDPGSLAPRPKGASPEVASRALWELYALLGEEGR